MNCRWSRAGLVTFHVAETEKNSPSCPGAFGGRCGKSLHEDFHGMTGIDLNRALTPLLEIVSELRYAQAAAEAAWLRPKP